MSGKKFELDTTEEQMQVERGVMADVDILFEADEEAERVAEEKKKELLEAVEKQSLAEKYHKLFQEFADEYNTRFGEEGHHVIHKMTGSIGGEFVITVKEGYELDADFGYGIMSIEKTKYAGQWSSRVVSVGPAIRVGTNWNGIRRNTYLYGKKGWTDAAFNAFNESIYKGIYEEGLRIERAESQDKMKGLLKQLGMDNEKTNIATRTLGELVKTDRDGGIGKVMMKDNNADTVRVSLELSVRVPNERAVEIFKLFEGVLVEAYTDSQGE